MGYGLEYLIEIMCFRVFKNRLRIQQNIVQKKEAYPCKDNVSISLR